MEQAERGLIAAQPLLLQQRWLAGRGGKGVGRNAACKRLALARPELREEGAAADSRRQGAVAGHGRSGLLEAGAALPHGAGGEPAAGGVGWLRCAAALALWGRLALLRPPTRNCQAQLMKAGGRGRRCALGCGQALT